MTRRGVGKFVRWIGVGIFGMGAAFAAGIEITPNPWGWLPTAMWVILIAGIVIYGAGWIVGGKLHPIAAVPDADRAAEPTTAPGSSVTFDMRGGSLKGGHITSKAQKVVQSENTDIEPGTVDHDPSEQ